MANLKNGLSSEQSKKNFKKISPLPAEYVNIKKLFTFPGNPDKCLWTPLCFINPEDMLKFPNFDVTFDEELAWLCYVQQSFSTYAEDTEHLGWARHHSHFNRGPKQPPGINTMNLFQTQGHGMTLNINSTRTLDPTQTPIDVSDQPVYALTKELQYRYPHPFEKYCPIMGACI